MKYGIPNYFDICWVSPPVNSQRYRRANQDVATFNNLIRNLCPTRLFSSMQTCILVGTYLVTRRNQSRQKEFGQNYHIYHKYEETF